MKLTVFILLCIVAGVFGAGTWSNNNNGPYGGRVGGNNYGGRPGGGYRPSRNSESSSESSESKECEKTRPPCREVYSCEKEPVFSLAPGVNQKCEIGTDSTTIEIDCERCCETWALSKGVAKDKQTGSYDYTNQDCYCCKLQCPRF